MPFHQNHSLRYFTFDSLDQHGVVHAVFTRRGGVSPKPWDSLNVGGTVGDQADRVRENRRRTFEALGLPLESTYDVYQVHGCQVVFTEAPRPSDIPHLRADAILTNRPGVTLFMRFADCVPIFLFDPCCKVIGLVHAGRQGTLLRVAALAVQSMQARYGSQPEDILAGIGPSVAAHHYPIGADIAHQILTVFGSHGHSFLQNQSGEKADFKVQLDLWRANRFILEQCGVRHIEVCGICTACNLEDWYSHRGENGRTGRFGALIALQA